MTFTDEGVAMHNSNGAFQHIILTQYGQQENTHEVLLHACVGVHRPRINTTKACVCAINVLYVYCHGNGIAELHLHEANVLSKHYTVSEASVYETEAMSVDE